MVTGATRGIGEQMAVAMAEAGADIILIQVRITSYQPLGSKRGRNVNAFVLER